jgi:hypothetical protein
MEKKYQICCISHGRWENVKSIHEKFGTDDIVWFVKDAHDADQYIRNGAKQVKQSGSLMDSRNSALEYCFKLKLICVQLSDDLEKITVNDFTGKRTGITVTALEAIEDMIPALLESKCLFAGLPPTDNPFFALNEFENDKFIVGDFILVKPCPFKFDSNLKLKEDYDYTLQHISEAWGTLRFGKYLASFKHYKNKGGAVDYRTTELEQKTIKQLQEKWGECIRLNPKRENEILLAKNCKQILTSNQGSLF